MGGVTECVDQNVDKYGVEVKDAVGKNFYVDDLIKSLRDVETARNFRKDATAALKDAGFDLCKWHSSHPGILEEEDENGGVPQLNCLGPEVAGEDKILGMRYDFVSDEFYFLTDPVKFLL